jgi:ABC-type lipoprotein export system ATPase subunit
MSIRSTQFALASLTLLDIGPLRDTTSISFLTTEHEPANIYLVMGPNGGGKTTLLEAITTAMSMLGAASHARYGMPSLDDGTGGVQLDALVRLDDGKSGENFILSIVLGGPGLLKNWNEPDLQTIGATAQIVLRYGVRPGSRTIERFPDSDPQALAFADTIIDELGEPTRGLFGAGATAFPTLLYFPSDRGIARGGHAGRVIARPDQLSYAPVHVFGVDGATWESSLDNLFVWFAWLGDGREDLCREIVNRYVFRDGNKKLLEVDREQLRAPVSVNDIVEHGLDQLSSGERQLVQLLVRVASHMSSATIVLIDETEQHLHLVMRRRLITLIKEWTKEHSGLSFYLTSHQADSLRMVAPKIPEEGLRKFGCLVKPRFKVSRR